MLKKINANKKGFTLAELLIVVAIIGVLVAISIPIFTKQLEKAREATDAANLRGAYARVMAEAVSNDQEVDVNNIIAESVEILQTEPGWQYVNKDGNDLPFKISGNTEIKKGCTVIIGFDRASNKVIFTIE